MLLFSPLEIHEQLIVWREKRLGFGGKGMQELVLSMGLKELWRSERRETYFPHYLLLSGGLHYGHSDTDQEPEFSRNSGTLGIIQRLLVVWFVSSLSFICRSHRLASPLELVPRREETFRRDQDASSGNSQRSFRFMGQTVRGLTHLK
jgi:hypothetical protein